MAYASENDPLYYPGTSVLKNLLDLRNQSDLDEYETAMFVLRSEGPWPSGNFDTLHYLSIHHHLFQDVYAWAGEIRTIRIGKGGNWFCFPEYIAHELERVFSELVAKNYLVGTAPPVFADKAAHFIAELNAIHPFREGNGRTQLTFLGLLSEHAGLHFNANVLTQDRVIQAMIDSFAGSERPLAELIFDIVTV